MWINNQQIALNNILTFHYWSTNIYLTGGGAWTAGTTDSNQYLGIDLGYRQVIKYIETQGRRGSNEYVLEYYVWFSDDNTTWRVYTNEFGTPMVVENLYHDSSFIYE